MAQDKTGEILEAVGKFLLAKTNQLPGVITNLVSELIGTLIRVALWSMGTFVLCLVISAVTGFQNFLFYVSIPYLLLIAAILRGGQALRAAGLLVGWDALRDTLEKGKGLRVVESDGTRTIELDYPKLEKLQSLVYVGRVVFYIVLLELIVLALFGFIPIWEHPLLIGPLFLVGLIWVLLETPWAKDSFFEEFKGVARAIWLLLVVIFFTHHLYEVVWGVTQTAITHAEQLDSAPHIPWILIFGLIGIIYLISTIPAKAPEKKQ